MYISPEQLALRLAGQSNLELRGREGVGRHSTLSHETKILAGVLAKTDTQKNVAEALGTSPSNVSHIVNNPALKDEIETASKKTAEGVSSKAVDILMKSLGVVDDKVKNVRTAVEASIVAKNVAGIVQQFTPRASGESSFAPKILINIHGSKQKSENDYEAIEVEAVAQ